MLKKLTNMEWTKEKENTYIKFKSKEKRDKIIKFYLDSGFSIGSFLRDPNFPNKIKNGIIYANALGYIHWRAEWNENYLFNFKEIKLPYSPRRKFPRAMLVSDDKKTWAERLIFGKIKNSTGGYLSRSPFQGNWFIGWKYAKEIN